MNEHHGASADGLLLLWRLASPSHSISALCQLRVLYALSNALPNQFCMVNKSRDFATDCSGCWRMQDILSWLLPLAKVTIPTYLSPPLCGRLLPSHLPAELLL